MLYLKKNKERKTLGHIIILHQWTKNVDDMIYSSWNIECDPEISNYGSFFALLPP